jgi:transcriptional regulator with XRE-family HTH domain
MTEPRVTTLAELEAEWAADPEHFIAEWRHKPYFLVAQDVFELRQELNLTQAELAEQADTHQSRISKLEGAELDPKLSTLIKVAEALGAHVNIRLCRNGIAVDGGYQSLFTKRVSTQSGTNPQLRIASMREIGAGH